MLAVIHPPLRPRDVHYEQTPQQQAARLARLQRLALEALLHDYFRPYNLPTEPVYQGSMNKAPERSESETGCDLTDLFTSWLEGKGLIDAEEAQRRRKLTAALDLLYHAQPYAHLVVTERARTKRKLSQMAAAWQHGARRVGLAYGEGLTLLLGYLNRPE